VFSRWLIGSSVTQWFTGNSFVLASAVVMGPAIVGLIRVAQNLMGVTHVIFLAMENYAPQAALRQLRSDGILGLKKYISKLALINLQIVMFFICLLWIFPDAIIQFLYGEEYLKHLDFLLVYLFVYFAIALNATLKIYHRTIINTKAIFTADMISAVYSILLAYPLVSFFLDDGVIYGTITASTIVTLVLLFKIKVGREL
jgi:O-antigen/teichoic acid export membrane protein